MRKREDIHMKINGFIACLAAILALLCGTGTARAGQPGMDMALCVGAGNYQHFPALSSPHHDSLALSRQLDDIGDFRRIVILSDLSPEGAPNQVRFLPTHKNIVDMLKMFASATPPNGGILVYLRGYAEMKDGQAHYLPVDARPGGGISVQEIVDILDSGQAGRKVVLFDAANPDPDGAAPLGGVPASGNTVVVYSHEDEQSPLPDKDTGRSLFSRAIENLFLDIAGEVSVSAGGFVSRVNRYMSEYCLENFILAGQSAVMRGSDGELVVMNARQRTAGKRSAILSIPGGSTARRAAPRPAVAANRSAAPAPARTQVASRNPDPAAPAAAPGAAISAKAQNLRFNAERQFRAENYGGALNLFREAAAEGDPVSEKYIGDLHFEGLGTENNFAEAKTRYQRAADAGDASAQDNLGFMLEHGIAGAADPAKAAEWYAKAHAQGYQPAAYHLARLYNDGRGVEKDAARLNQLLGAFQGGDAEKLFLDAANRGFARAQYEMGRLYQEGLAVKQDMRQAVEWYKKIASHDRAAKGSREIADMLYNLNPSAHEEIITNYLSAIEPVLGFGVK
jgi:TPR repeat protein